MPPLMPPAMESTPDPQSIFEQFDSFDLTPHFDDFESLGGSKRSRCRHCGHETRRQRRDMFAHLLRACPNYKTTAIAEKLRADLSVYLAINRLRPKRRSGQNGARTQMPGPARVQTTMGASQQQTSQASRSSDDLARASSDINYTDDNTEDASSVNFNANRSTSSYSAPPSVDQDEEDEAETIHAVPRKRRKGQQTETKDLRAAHRPSKRPRNGSMTWHEDPDADPDSLHNETPTMDEDESQTIVVNIPRQHPSRQTEYEGDITLQRLSGRSRNSNPNWREDAEAIVDSRLSVPNAAELGPVRRAINRLGRHGRYGDEAMSSIRDMWQTKVSEALGEMVTSEADAVRMVGDLLRVAEERQGRGFSGRVLRQVEDYMADPGI
jgi:hypothetical protein